MNIIDEFSKKALERFPKCEVKMTWKHDAHFIDLFIIKDSKDKKIIKQLSIYPKELNDKSPADFDKFLEETEKEFGLFA